MSCHLNNYTDRPNGSAIITGFHAIDDVFDMTLAQCYGAEITIGSNLVEGKSTVK